MSVSTTTMILAMPKSVTV